MEIGEIRDVMQEAGAWLKLDGSPEAIGLARRMIEAQQSLFEYAQRRNHSQAGEVDALRRQRDGYMQEAASLRIQRDDMLAAIEGFQGKLQEALRIKEQERQAQANDQVDITDPEAVKAALSKPSPGEPTAIYQWLNMPAMMDPFEGRCPTCSGIIGRKASCPCCCAYADWRGWMNREAAKSNSRG